ncbi:protein of unknown function DUF481 [Ferrimonas balearica DSM 9799]|uniref:Salt-induced outer membrane protein n=1 Tax=Ferrimonas balearica (strain DSM 9799 / CCM 4581 / KCTC 23876 / PAT) TaxID=550540 RepID=E1SUH0_FERBD|nr:DUF481 domain-containing protein [Ferrimonas balearica]ADN77277.1 protein of unknown function DUF481 [Ferrimonas balearica DSM 9799]MBY5980382.1 DUF481 domain-containing protein [Ferrimonas balearica]
MKAINTITASLLLALGSAIPAMAEDAPPPPFSGTAELGATIVSGNTETTNIKGKVDATHLIGDLKNQYLLDILYAEDTGERSGERYYALYQGDYPATGKQYMFGMVDGEIDKFTDYEYIVSAALGYGRRIIEQDTMTLLAEAGPGYSYKKYDDDLRPDEDDESDFIARVKVDFWWQFSESAEFGQLITSNIALGDGSTITRSETYVSAALVGSLAMKLSYSVKHDSDPGPDNKSTDTTLAATLLYKF